MCKAKLTLDVKIILHPVRKIDKYDERYDEIKKDIEP